MTACVELDRNRSLPTRPSSKGAGSRFSINAILPASQPAFICAGCKGRGLGLSPYLRERRVGSPKSARRRVSVSTVSNRLALVVRTFSRRGVVRRWGRRLLTLAFRPLATDGQERTRDCGRRASSSWITTAAVDGLPCASRGVSRWSRWSRCASLGRVAARLGPASSTRVGRRAAPPRRRTGPGGLRPA